MDHSTFARYTQQVNGVPQESKLAGYMSRQNPATPVVNHLHQSFATKLNIGSPISSKKVQPHTPEFVPRAVSSASGSPNIFNSSYSPIIDGGHQHGYNKSIEDMENPSPLATPIASPPPHAVNNVSPHPLEKSGNSLTTLTAYQENVGGTTYFYPTATEPIPPAEPVPNKGVNTEYHVYPGTPSHIASLKAKHDSSYFISEDVVANIHARNDLSLLQADPQQFPDIPAEVENYHELYPLEPIPNNAVQKAHLGYQASMYKATHVKTGTHYCLRRIHSFRFQNTKCTVFVEVWKKLSHSNIVQLREVFTTKAFGDTSLVFVYDYHPGSETLLNKHFSPDQLGYSDPFAADTSTPRPYSHQKNSIMRHAQNNKLPEPLIWNYIIQLTSALRLIHANGLACRSLDPTKVIITSKNRLRLSCVGVMDVMVNENPGSMNPMALVQHYQQEDLTSLGKLVLALACKSTMSVQRENITTALELVGRTYTGDLRNLIMYLLSTQQRRSVTDLMPMIGARFYTQMDNLQSHIEVLENELSKEVENGRLFRLLSKLSTVNERSDLHMDGAWSETGDRYMLKLFRDYIFHQVTENGAPWLDMSHIVQCLNKLDAGVPEKVCLMSRDEQSILVVSYAELKHCLEQSFEEVLNASLAAEDLSIENKM